MKQPSTSAAPAVTRSFRARPWWPWLLTFPAAPLGSVLGRAVAGRVDSVASALAAGVVTGAVIGAAQWALLRRRDVGTAWPFATAGGLGAGLAISAAAVSYRTDRPALVVMGAVCGLAVGLAQVGTAKHARHAASWVIAATVLWAVGWVVTDLVIGDYVDEQWSVFGSSGAIVVALGQSLLVRRCFPGATEVR